MQIPSIKLSDATKNSIQNILKASKGETTICQQMQMTNYYAFLCSEKNSAIDSVNYAKMLIGK